MLLLECLLDASANFLLPPYVIGKSEIASVLAVVFDLRLCSFGGSIWNVHDCLDKIKVSRAWEKTEIQ